METAIFYSLVALCGFMTLSGFAQPNGHLGFPTLFACVMIGWFLPQLWSIRSGAAWIESGPLVNLEIASILSVLGVSLGWRWGMASGASGRLGRWSSPSYKTLERITVVLTAVAWAMALAIASFDVDERNVSTWSGPLTILYFFSSIKVLSLFLSVFLVLSGRRTRLTWLLVGANSLIYAPAVLMYFRRRAMAELFLCVLLALWFARGRNPPRIIIFAGMLVGTLAVFGVGALRAAAKNPMTGEWSIPSLSELAAIDFWGATPFASGHNTPEVANALHIVGLSDALGVHSWGAEAWNRFVFQWVPAQIVGAQVKAAFVIDAGLADLRTFDPYFEARTGSAPTAVGTAYLDFGMAGAAYFVATAFVLGRWWRRAHRGDMQAAILYSAGLVPAVIMPTAYAFYFFNVIPLYVGALFACAFILRLLKLASFEHPADSTAKRSGSNEADFDVPTKL